MSDWSRDPGAPRASRWRALLLLCLVMFVAGACAAVWVVNRLHRGEPQPPARVVRVPVPVAAASTPPPLPSSTAGGAAAPANTPADVTALSTRLGAIEARLDDVDQRSRAAVGDAGRAEGLLVAVAARRALDAGMPLGYLEGLLRERFGATHAAAVATILSAARQPVTLDELRAGLDALAPALSRNSGAADSWWSRFTGELSQLVVVRRAGMPSTLPADRVAHAQRLLDDGHVDGALAEVARLPARDAAGDWMGQARRYLAARGALEQVETAALLEPAAPPPALATVQPAPAAAAAPSSPSSPAPPPP